MTEKAKVGIIGCVVISGTYLKVRPASDRLEVVACAGPLIERAQARGRVRWTARLPA